MALKNARHEAFAQHLTKGCTQTEAATIAGYSERSTRKQGSRLQTNVRGPETNLRRG
jgi:phage terminase small subunit